MPEPVPSASAYLGAVLNYVLNNPKLALPGHVEVDPSARRVRCGDHREAPSRFVYVDILNKSMIEFRITCWVTAEGEAQVDALRFTRSPEGVSITSGRLMATTIKIDKLVSQIVTAISARLALMPRDPQDLINMYDEPSPELERLMGLTKRGRKPLSAAHLQAVAEIVQAAPTSIDAIETIMRRFDVAQSTAFRQVQRAREAGLLPASPSDTTKET